MAKKNTNSKVKKSADLVFSEVESKKTLTLKQKYQYLEQLRDYIYKDVVLADNKAGLALTMVTVTIAAAFALFKEVNIFWILGLTFSGLSMFCSMLTILPRSYVTHAMVMNPDHWVNLKQGWLNEINRRFRDAFNVLFENLWQKQSKGTTNSLKLLLNSGTEAEVVNSLYEAMKRAFLAQTLKYLWAGKALLFAFLAFCSIALSLAVSVGNVDNNKSEVPKENTIVVNSVSKDEKSLLKSDTLTIDSTCNKTETKNDTIEKNNDEYMEEELRVEKRNEIEIDAFINEGE